MGEAGFIPLGVCRRALAANLIECENLGPRPFDLLDVEMDPSPAQLGLSFAQGRLAFNCLPGLVGELTLKRGSSSAGRLPSQSDGLTDRVQQASNLCEQG